MSLLIESVPSCFLIVCKIFSLEGLLALAPPYLLFALDLESEWPSLQSSWTFHKTGSIKEGMEEWGQRRIFQIIIAILKISQRITLSNTDIAKYAWYSYHYKNWDLNILNPSYFLRTVKVSWYADKLTSEILIFEILIFWTHLTSWGQ